VLRRTVVAALAVAALVTACDSGSTGVNQAGGCDIKPHTVCKDMDLRGVSMVSADLTGADFSGTDLRGSDLRQVKLDGANLTGANLGDINFTGASLKGANMSKAYLFQTNFTNADLDDTNTTGAFICNMTAPDGGFEAGNCAANPNAPPTTAPGTPTGSPAIVSFAFAPPGKCLNDSAGDGIEVNYRTKNTTGIVFVVDDIRIDGESKPSGLKRLPFVCDGKPHTVQIWAYGALNTSVKQSLTASLPPAAPLTDKS
jgi:uncharacterized protein YjbI with pentapeptide repeats